jgi:hypothetical protein
VHVVRVILLFVRFVYKNDGRLINGKKLAEPPTGSVTNVKETAFVRLVNQRAKEARRSRSTFKIVCSFD